MDDFGFLTQGGRDDWSHAGPEADRRPPETTRVMRFVRTPRTRLLTDLQAARCAEQLAPLPDAGERVIALTCPDRRDAWYAWTLVPAILRLSGRRITHLRVATLSLATSNVAHLLELLDDGSVGRASVLVSEMHDAHHAEQTAAVATELRRRGSRLGVDRNHAKLICCEMDDGRRFAMHGSANVATCTCRENLCLDADAEVHDFFARAIDAALEAVHA